MIRISLSSSEIGQTLSAPLEDAWEILTDTNRWTDWGPSITSVDCADRYIKAGTQGKIKVYPGIWAPFVITSFKDRRFWSWEIWGIHATGHRVEPLDHFRCNLFFEVPALAAPYLLICWIAIRNIRTLLEG